MSTPMMPPPGCSFTDLPGIRYHGGAQAVGVAAEHVEALEALGWQRVGSTTPPRVPTPAENHAARERAERASWRHLPAGAPMARVIPPTVGTLQIEGRIYTSKNGAAQDVALEDSRVLAANGWLLFGHSGPLASRPAQPRTGEIFVVTPAEQILQFDGRAWRDVTTGEVVS